MTGLFGSVFDPPHDGHVALLRDARAHFGFDRVVVLVVAEPGHKRVATDASVRLELARLAFPGEEVELDRHARTIDTLRDGALRRPGLPRRRRPVRRLPEPGRSRTASSSWRASASRRGPGFSRASLEPRAGGARAPRSRRALRDRAAGRVLERRPRARRRAASRSTGSSRAAVAAEIERLGLYRSDG